MAREPIKPIVYIVDDDAAVRDSLSLLARSADLDPVSFGTAQAFLDRYDASISGCLVLDMDLPELSGLDLLGRLTALRSHLPVIILTGHGDVPAAVRAMKTGAMDFFEKPFDGETLLARIQEAVARDLDRQRESAERHDLAARLARLTPREREIMEMIVEGKTNKVIAIDLHISERTVELHRSRIMNKMQTRSLAELVQAVVAHGPTRTQPVEAKQRHSG
jgi:two-component system response regulator FixJ